MNTLISYGLLVLALLTVAGVTGYSIKQSACQKAALEQQVKVEQQTKLAVIKALKEQENQHQVDDSIITSYVNSLEIERDKNADLIAELKKQTPKHQQDNSACNITRGVVSVLNSTARTSRSKVSEPSKLSTEEASTYSTVTESALIEQCNAWVTEYNKLYLQLNALIDWHEETNK